MKTQAVIFLFALACFRLASQNVWVPLNSGTQKDLSALSFPTSQTGYVVGKSGTILKTTDAGTNWSSLFSDTTQDFVSVHFPKQSSGYALTSDRLYRTANGGSSWQMVYADTLLFHVVYFINDSTGFIGTENSILKTVNYGQTWTIIKNTPHRINTITFPSLAAGYFAGGSDFSNMIYKTSNQGQSFTSYNLGLQSIKESVYFINDTIGYLTGWYGGALVKTIDGAQSWAAANSANDPQGWDVYFRDEAHGFYIDNASGQSRILSSANSGVSWTTDISASLYTFKKFAFTSAGKGFAVGYNGNIHSTQLQASLGETDPVPLFKVWPNPGKGQFRIVASKDLHLLLLNELGQRVEDIHLSADNSYQYECKTLPAGAYFLKGEKQSGNIHQKIIILK